MLASMDTIMIVHAILDCSIKVAVLVFNHISVINDVFLRWRADFERTD